MVFAIFASLWDACASETAGSSMVEKDMVMEEGNKRSGRVIPVKTPYMLRDCEEVKP